MINEIEGTYTHQGRGLMVSAVVKEIHILWVVLHLRTLPLKILSNPEMFEMCWHQEQGKE